MNLLGLILSTGFSQTAHEKDVKDFIWRAKETAQKHLKIFAKTLVDSDIQSPMSWDTETYETQGKVFSEKLMMFHIDMLLAVGVGNYATAAAASLRNDLAFNYTRLSAEVAQFAKDGMQIMIRNGWLEEPP